MRAIKAMDAPGSARGRRLVSSGGEQRRRAPMAGVLALTAILSAGAAAAQDGGAGLGGEDEIELLEDATIAFDQMPTSELLDLFMDVGLVLRHRELLPKSWNPAQDYAQILVRRALRLSVGGQQDRAEGPGGVRFRIVGMRLGPEAGAARISGLETTDFDRLVVVLFEKRFVIDRAFVVPSDLIAAKASGGALELTPDVVNGAGVEDVTAKVDRFTGDEFR